MMTELPRRIGRLIIAAGVVARSRELLDPFRARRVEGCLLWYGYVLDAETCLVTTCVQPAQSGTALAYSVSADAMRAVRREVRLHGLLLIVQIHSHPEEAFFSTWDEDNALNRRTGALNLVVPEHGNVEWLDDERFCMVERTEHGQWEPWSSQDWSRVVVVPEMLIPHSP